MFERIREILPKRSHPARQYCPELRIKLVSSSGISPPRRKFNNSSVEYRISYAVPRDLQVSKSRMTIIRDNSSRDVDGASSALASPGFLITDRYSHQLAHPLFTCSKVAKLPPQRSTRSSIPLNRSRGTVVGPSKPIVREASKSSASSNAWIRERGLMRS